MQKNLTIGIIGGGLMGHGIALVMARAGQQVAITDPMPEARDALPGRVRESMALMGHDERSISETVSRITVHETLEGAVKNAFAVFEAAPEKMALKQEIFARIEAAAPRDCILASNTSVMPITQIMQGLTHRDRALGTHWWNPPHMIPLVEVIRTEWTRTATMDSMVALLADAGKTPVKVEKDVPGFIGNRLQHALWREAVSLVERGICDAESVDLVVKSCFGRRLSVLGPLENADLVGTDLTLDIHNTVLADLESRQGPSPYLEKLVSDGKLGMKSGEGFRQWTPEEATRVRNRVTTHLRKLEGLLNDD